MAHFQCDAAPVWESHKADEREVVSGLGVGIVSAREGDPIVETGAPLRVSETGSGK